MSQSRASQLLSASSVESVGFYAQKIEIDDMPGRILTAVACVPTTAPVIENRYNE